MKPIAAALVLLVCAQPAPADFVERFQDKQLAIDPQGHRGWAMLTGSGEATIAFTREKGRGIVEIDATKDRRNIWWAVIKRAVSPFIDRSALGRPGKALRVEAKVRLNHAPRRINLSFNHTRTRNYDVNLAEFDIADTGWHVISYTDKSFDAAPDDEVFAQLAMMDGGRQRHRIEIAWFKVSVVDAEKAPPDLGNPMAYRPLPQPLDSYAQAVPAAEDAVIDSSYRWVNFKNWSDRTAGDASPLIAVGGTMTSLLRFDLSRFKGRPVAGWGVLALTTNTVHWAPTNLEEFGYLRVVEIVAGEPAWKRETVTWDSFFAGKPELDVLNGQLIVDTPPAVHRGELTLVRINPAVMQRLISGESKGLALYAQGEVYASFASGRSAGGRPILYFTTK